MWLIYLFLLVYLYAEKLSWNGAVNLPELTFFESTCKDFHKDLLMSLVKIAFCFHCRTIRICLIIMMTQAAVISDSSIL